LNKDFFFLKNVIDDRTKSWTWFP